MLNSIKWWVAFVCVAMVAGCEGPPPAEDGGQQVDAGPTLDGGSDPCEGRALCTTAGTTCDTDSLVTCAADADGCLIETRTDCGASGEICDDGGATAACVDPCSLIAAADRCDTVDARACVADSLEICTMNADGCLVLERTDCAAAPGGVCDESGAMPVCEIPADPCADIPAADRCDTAGTSCDADTLADCAPDAFGCLVVTRTDCTARAGGSCDATAAPPMCVSTGDPCDGITQCAAEGSSCDGPELVECAPDAFGCLVETRTTCTDAPFGFCDDAASPAAMCSTAATDPCMGVTECGTSSTRVCTDSSTLDTCTPNAFGCFVPSTTDCSASSEVCDDTSGTAACVDPCSLITTCPSASYCDGADVVSCTANADGCLVETDRAPCIESCDATTGTAECIDTICPEAGTRIIDCASGTVAGDTAMGSTALTAYPGCTSSTSYARGEQIWRFRNASRADVRVVSTRGTSTLDYDLFVIDGGDGSGTCTSGLTCVDSGRGTSATETIDFVAEPGQTYFVVYDLFGSSTTPDATDYALDVTCVPLVCGDGVVAPSEDCDDGGTAAGDGCAADCTVETGSVCYGEPSRCGAAAANSTCAGAIALAGTIAGEDPDAGGAGSTSTTCGPTPGGGTLYYTLTIPPGERATVTAMPSSALDVSLARRNSCTTTVCIARVDEGGAGAAETLIVDNYGTSAATHVVMLSSVDGTATGTADISVSFSTAPGYTRTPVVASCTDMSSATPVSGVTSDDSASSITALPFSISYFGESMTHYSVTSNGFMQLWPSSSGSPSTTFTNASMPNTSTPNAVVAPYWDDLRPQSGADVRTLVEGAAGSQVFSVQWTDWRATSTGLESLTFQAKLHEATGIIEFHYCAMLPDVPPDDAHTGGSATIGLENRFGTGASMHSHNTAGSVATAAGIRFTPTP